jgi:hypothetical protein
MHLHLPNAWVISLLPLTFAAAALLTNRPALWQSFLAVFLDIRINAILTPDLIAILKTALRGGTISMPTLHAPPESLLELSNQCARAWGGLDPLSIRNLCSGILQDTQTSALLLLTPTAQRASLATILHAKITRRYMSASSETLILLGSSAVIAQHGRHIESAKTTVAHVARSFSREESALQGSAWINDLYAKYFCHQLAQGASCPLLVGWHTHKERLRPTISPPPTLNISKMLRLHQLISKRLISQDKDRMVGGTHLLPPPEFFLH